MVVWFTRSDITIEAGFPLFLWLAVVDLVIGVLLCVGGY
jgi:hypothetical protein